MSTTAAANKPEESPPAPQPPRALIVDDDPIVAESLAALLGQWGYEVSTALNGAEALSAVSEASGAASGATRRPRPFALAICDMSLPGMNGLELLKKLQAEQPALVVIMLTGYGTIESAVECIRAGAFDYLSKPVVETELRLVLERALRQQTLLAENSALRERLDARHGLGSIIGHDYRMVKAFEMIQAVAASKVTVLMTGESGTGKSVVARAIHQLSSRRSAPFVEIHCGSIPETLLESELFGHVKGAFTGAHADKQGKFLAADTGTIFIDEINSASPGMQLKLLRVLQERKFEPVGSTDTVEVDVRVILASNQPLETLVAAGQFRQDLYYRINVVKIELPPLRDRAADIPSLAEHFLGRCSAEHGKTVTGVDAAALDALRRYAFPGNVRELENIIERAVVLARRPTITLEDLPPHVLDNSSTLMPAHARAGLAADEAPDAPDTPWQPIPLAVALEQPEKRILLKALRANEWNRQKTAEQLDINRTTLYKKMKQYGLDRMAG
ncbi:MAG: sigma-54-dependent Fis family transcriptional regulator [Phycisphaerales bacterium]|nr:sigma-54-dependent Fis family transcriptional regulator [Phycisphaerales bacterium]